MNNPHSEAEIAPASPNASLPQAAVAHRRRIGVVWAIPVVTLLIGAYLAYNTLSKRGPTITVTFEAAEGLVAGTSQIKHKDITLGTISTVVLSKDLNHVVLTAQMTREAEPLLTDLAQLWVVKPRLFAGSLSGLDTLLSGSYVELLPSAAGGKPQREFQGLEDPPVLVSEAPGTTFLLKAGKLGAISLGSPIFYRDLSVGQVLGWDLGDMAETVTIHAFVRAPFDQYVHEKSRFWNASGLTVKMGAEGIQLQVDSLKAVLLGGVAFDTPAAARTGPKVTRNQVFPLFASQAAADDSDFTRRVPLIAYFDGAVDGLTIGSPVTFRGLKVGEVTGVTMRYDPKLDTVVAPVSFVVEPDRVADSAVVAGRGPLANFRDLVKRGLRAQLKSTNLITGAMSVSMDFETDAEPAELGQEGDVLVVPTVAGGFAGITKSVNDLLAKLTRLPFAQIAASLNGALSGADKLTNGAETQAAIMALTATLQSTQDVMKRLDAGAAPALKRLPDIAAGLEGTVTRANKLLGGMDAGYGPGSQVNRDLARILVELTDTARSVRVLADLLTRHPEALIRGRTNTGAQ